MFPGLHLYFDCVDAECRQVDEDCAEASLLVNLGYVEGKQVLTVCHPEDEDAGLELDVDDLTGVMEPLKPRAPLKAQRIDHTTPE